jgi:hypothetical protein
VTDYKDAKERKGGREGRREKINKSINAELGVQIADSSSDRISHSPQIRISTSRAMVSQLASMPHRSDTASQCSGRSSPTEPESSGGAQPA